MNANITYKATNVELQQSWKLLFEQKSNALTKYFQDDDDIQCSVEFEKETAHQNGKYHRVEVNLRHNGQFFRAESTKETFEEAVDEVLAEINKMLRRSQKKRGTLLKKGGRLLKRLARRS